MQISAHLVQQTEFGNAAPHLVGFRADPGIPGPGGLRQLRRLAKAQCAEPDAEPAEIVSCGAAADLIFLIQHPFRPTARPVD